MTKQEQTNNRSLEFSHWIRQQLPDSSTGFCVSDQDWVFYNYKTKQLMFCEEKTRMGKISDWFRTLIKNILHPALRLYCPKNGIDYRGYHLIQFENTSPVDGKIYLDYNLITEQQLIEFLSFRQHLK